MASYRDTVLADAPVAYWRLGERTGTSAADSSGNGYTATYSSVTLGVNGPLAEGNFAVTGGNASVPALGGPTPNDTISIEFWFKGTDTAAQFSPCGPTRTQAGTKGWQIDKRGLSPSGSVGVRIDTSAGLNQVKTVTGQTFDGAWHHLVLVLNNGNWQWYKDGNLDGSGTYLHGTGFGNAAASLFPHVGSNYGTSSDEVAIYNYALTATQVAIHYAARLAAPYARLGCMRLSRQRLDYYQPWFKVKINGVDRTANTRIIGATITQNLDGIPDTAAFRIAGITPTKGQDIKVYMGDTDVSHCLFAGHILSAKTVYEGIATNVVYDIACIDYTWLLNHKKILTKYTNASATDIVTGLIGGYTSGFTTVNVATGLATIDEITFTNEDITDALDRVAERIGGYWYVDYGKDLHFFVTDPTGIAQSVTDGDCKTWDDASLDVDLSQVRTRAIVRGGGSNTSSDVNVGSTTLPVVSDEWYSSSGGYVECGPQRITYTGRAAQAGQGCVTSGIPGNAPSAPSPVALNGTSVTLLTSAARTTSGSGSGSSSSAKSVGELTLSVTAASGSSPSLTVTIETSPDNSTWSTVASFAVKTGTGSETKVFSGLNAFTRASYTITGTTPSFTFSVSGVLQLDTPSATSRQTGNLLPGVFGYAATFVTASGEGDLSPIASVTIPIVDAPTSSPTLTPTTGGSLTSSSTYQYFITFKTALGETTSTNAAFAVLSSSQNAVSLTNITTSADGRVTGRVIYRTDHFGSGRRLVATINDNTTTTYTDTLADASLGADAPGANTAGSGQVIVSSIGIGATGTTSRKLYRTVRNGSSPQLLATISDNTTTTYADNTADGSLGAASAGSTLGAAAGQTTLRLSDLSAVPDAGWLRIGSQVVSYTARAAASGSGNVTGIPAAGAGAITAQIPVATAVVVEPHLTGIPASGAGSISFAIKSGDPVNVRVERNDTTAQTNLASFLGTGDGVIEGYISDGRIGATEAANRGDAELTAHKDPLLTVTGNTRDQTARAGRTVTFSLTNPPISGTFKIQRVTITEIAAAGGSLNYIFPRRQVDASSQRFSLEDLLRQMRNATAT